MNTVSVSGCMQRLMNFQLPKEFLIVGFASMLFGVLPFAIYAAETWAGLLLTREAWMDQGFNHGPWRWEAEGFTILYPLVLLALVTILVSAVGAVRWRQLQVIGAGLGLLALQISMVTLQLFFLFWLID